MKERILVLSNSIAGLYSFRKEVIKSYIDEGYDVYISTPKSNDTSFRDWFINCGCNIINTNFNNQGTNPILDLLLLLKYFRIICRIKPNLVLSYTIKPNIYGGMASAICRVPQIANITGLGAAVEYTSLLQKLTIFLYKLGLSKARTVFFQNEENRQFCLKKNIVKDNTKLIPGSGVNLNYHSFKDYPNIGDNIKFIFISRIRREKGIDEYLSMARELKERYPTLTFYVMGGCEGNYMDKLQQLHNKGTIVYLGKQVDVRPYIANAHCTIHPSFYPEGMSNVLLESCAAGRPIITTNRAGCREIVDNEINGYIVKSQDVNDLIEKVEKFINLPYEKKKQMGLNSRKKVELEFDRNLVIKAYIDETKKIL